MRNSKWKSSIVIVLFILCASYLYTKADMTFTNPVRIAFTDVNYTTLDRDGNQIVLDKSGRRLIKLNAADEVEFVINGSAKGKNGFNAATRVVTDGENHIYVLNLPKEEGGYRIKSEEIIEYSSEGKYIGILTTINHETPVLQQEIAGLYQVNGEFCYIQNQEDSFLLYNKNNELIKEYDLKGTNIYNVSYAIEPSSHEIYYSTKSGTICKYHEDGEPTILYDANTMEYLSIPREISFDPDGNLYFTDIGYRTVTRLNPDGSVIHVIADGEVGADIASKYIYYYMNASSGVTAATSDFITTYSGGNITSCYDIDYSNGYRVLIIFNWAAFVFIGIIILYLSVRLVIYIIRKGHKTFQIAMGVVLGVVCIAGIFLLIVIPEFEDRLIESELQRAQVLSHVTQIMLPVEEFERLDNTADYMSEDYVKVRDQLRNVYLSGSEGISDFYCLLYSVRDGVITCSFSLQEDTGAAYPYDWPYEDSDEQWIFTNKEGIVYKGLTNSDGSFLFVLNPIFDSENNVIGLIEVGTDLNSFNNETNRMIYKLFLHVVAVTIVVILIALELIIFLRGRNEFIKIKRGNTKGLSMQIPVDLLRILVFGIFFITNLSTSFFPLYAMEVANNTASIAIPDEVLAAVPISAEVLFGAIFSIMGGAVIRRLGQNKSAIVGSILMFIGLAMRIALPNIWILTLANSIMGSGWGILLLIVNTIIASGNEEEKNKGFAGYSAAALNGVNCGIVFGGFLVYWLSYNAIFAISMLLSILMVVYSAVYLYHTAGAQAYRTEKEKALSINLWQFFKGKGVLSFFLMIVIPVIACGYYLNYMYPILGSEYGLSETNVGYSYLFNGLCVICLSDFLTVYLSKKIGKVKSLVIASLIYAAAFLCVAYFQNIIALMVALILLGLSDSFGLPLQTSYYTDLEAVKKYGYEKAMGIYSMFENAAQAGGSFVFSYVLIIGVRQGLSLVLSIVTILALAFGVIFLIGRFRNHRVYEHSIE